ncbi:TolC family protein [Neisseria canis]|uniref:Outer membrane efflux protein n=1 Tax=Neisseria canis TaxID=493 RepID=A0A1X3D001_9NEIS|nr:TolC family protein [Neisseria canis]OSI13240.1 transporter [Neisseria canis]VEF01846.1 outer membrane efflux protein [Neisseria canis]
MKQAPFFQTGIRLAAVLVISACAAGPKTDSGLTVESSGSIISAEEAAKRYRIDTQWWAAYNNAGLNALIQQALANNADLKKAAINVNKALYQAKISGAGRLPTLDGSLSASTRENLKTGDGSQTFGSQVGLSYEIDLWRKLQAQTDARASEYQATRYDLESAKLALINNVADTYFNIAYLNEAISLSEQTLKRYQEINRIAAARYREGKVSSADPRQSEQTLLATQNNLINLKRTRDTQQQTLRNLLNLKPNEPIGIAEADYKLSNPIDVDLNVPVATLANRPDLRAAEARLQAAVSQVEAQKRSWYPSVTLGATLSTASDKAKTMFNVPFLGGNVSVNLPFLNWKTLKWEDKAAQADFDSAAVDFETALTTALNEVNTYYLAYGKARQTLVNVQQKYELDKKNSRYYQLRYQHGKNSLKDWLEALNTEYGSAQDALNQRYEVLRYENLIFKAMAGRYREVNQKQ